MKRKRGCVRFHKLRTNLMYLVAPPCWRARLEGVKIAELIAELIEGHIDAEARGDISMMDQFETALSKNGIRVKKVEDDD